MSPEKRFAVAVVLLVAGLVAFSGWMAAGKRPPKAQPSAFAQAVDLSAFENLAVHTDGRLKSFTSYAHEIMGFVLGPRQYLGQTQAFTYLDMMFRPEAYTSADVIFVKNQNLRHDIRDAFEGSPSYADAKDHGAYHQRMEDFSQWGLVSPEILAEPKVAVRMEALETDLIRSGKFVQAVKGAQSVMHPMNLKYGLKIVPPASGAFDEPWSSPATGSRVATTDAALGEQIADAWKNLEASWTEQDAVGVIAAAGRLADMLPRTVPVLYPDSEKLSWESWYFQHGNMTWIWTIYLLAVILLLLALVNRWKLAGTLGMSVFVIAFLLQSSALGLRWWVSGRWPNSNMFEAVTTSAWMGGCAALVFEFLGRRSAMSHVFALTSASASMVALMAASFLPLQLNPNIGNMMPVLHDIWLYIHTNMIIWSYILIFMASITGLLYLVHRACGAQRETLRMAGATFAEVGAVSSGGSSAGGGSAGGGPNLGVVLDGVTMALMKLSFIMLWSGLVMGAIWADHSWGRPWGWDPKEVFALCTFVVFAVLVHVRWKARDKGLWTAALAVTGAGVMLFNWIVINFFISGLHSYA